MKWSTFLLNVHSKKKIDISRAWLWTENHSSFSVRVKLDGSYTLYLGTIGGYIMTILIEDEKAKMQSSRQYLEENIEKLFALTLQNTLLTLCLGDRELSIWGEKYMAASGNILMKQVGLNLDQVDPRKIDPEHELSKYTQNFVLISDTKESARIVFHDNK